MARGFLRRMFPVPFGAQGKHEGQRLGMGKEVGLLAHGTQQIQRDHGAGGDEAGEQTVRLRDRGGIGRSLPVAHAGFDKGRRRRRQLRMPGQIKAQGMLFEPTLRVIEGEDGTLILAPVRRPCCLELFCYQESPFIERRKASSRRLQTT